MYYESSDFLETADSDTLKQIAHTRELTREYYFSDYYITCVSIFLHNNPVCDMIYSESEYRR